MKTKSEIIEIIEQTILKKELQYIREQDALAELLEYVRSSHDRRTEMAAYFDDPKEILKNAESEVNYGKEKFTNNPKNTEC